MRLGSIIGCFLLATTVEGAWGAEPLLLSDPARVGDADRALVLIHGLLGSPTTSFGNWPAIIGNDQTALPQHGKMSEFAVYAVDYEADFTSRAKLDDVAVGVARDLGASQIFKRHRHIWLVAHSMGGLVLKRTLALWTLEGKTILLDRIMAIGMLGVPSAGAPLADLARENGIDTIATTFGWNGSLVGDLTTNSGSYLDGLESDWMAVKRARDIAPQRRFTPIISCGFETKPEIDRHWWNALWLHLVGDDIDTIVPKLFASSACDERRGFSVKHTELIKPKSGSDSIHLWLRKLIEDSIIAGGQEQRAEITGGPLSVAPSTDFNLADKIDFQNQELLPANFDRATGLPKNPEAIEFADDQSKQFAAKFVIRGGPFTASTKLDAWEAVASKNTCMSVGHSPNRLVITLRIATELTKQCAAGASICRDLACN